MEILTFKGSEECLEGFRDSLRVNMEGNAVGMNRFIQRTVKTNVMKLNEHNVKVTIMHLPANFWNQGGGLSLPEFRPEIWKISKTGGCKANMKTDGKRAG
jgi:hypothetical protein